MFVGREVASSDHRKVVRHVAQVPLDDPGEHVCARPDMPCRCALHVELVEVGCCAGGEHEVV